MLGFVRTNRVKFIGKNPPATGPAIRPLLFGAPLMAPAFPNRIWANFQGLPIQP